MEQYASSMHGVDSPQFAIQKKRKRSLSKRNSSESVSEEQINAILDEIGIIRSAEKASQAGKVIDLLSPSSTEKKTQVEETIQNSTALSTALIFDTPDKTAHWVDLTSPPEVGDRAQLPSIHTSEASERSDNSGLSSVTHKSTTRLNDAADLVKNYHTGSKRSRTHKDEKLSTIEECRELSKRKLSGSHVTNIQSRMPTIKPKAQLWMALEEQLDRSATGEAIKAALHADHIAKRGGVCCLQSAFACKVPNVIRWSSNTNKLQILCIYTSAVDLLQILREKKYQGLVQIVQTTKRDCFPCETTHANLRIIWVVEGLDKAMIAQREVVNSIRQSSPTSNINECASSVDLLKITYQLYADQKVQMKQTCSTNDSVTCIALITQEFAAYYRKTCTSNIQEVLDAVPRLTSIRVLRDGRVDNVFANAWLRMLLLVPGVSEERAQAIVDHFPTFISLFEAYQDTTQSVQEKHSLLARTVEKCRIDQALSTKIYRVFGLEDPHAGL